MKNCFVIAPIGEPESETRKRSDQILKHVITPAVEPFGYKALRADQLPEPGIITNQVIQHIVNDPLVIADLTDRNPNVFYELAIRHAFQKPLIQMIRTGETIPFDVAGTRMIYIDHKDLDSVAQAKQEMEKQIRAIEGGSVQISNPISASLNLQSLRQNDNPEMQALANILTEIASLRNALTRLDSKLSSLSSPLDATSEVPPRWAREPQGMHEQQLPLSERSSDTLPVWRINRGIFLGAAIVIVLIVLGSAFLYTIQPILGLGFFVFVGLVVITPPIISWLQNRKGFN